MPLEVAFLAHGDLIFREVVLSGQPFGCFPCRRLKEFLHLSHVGLSPDKRKAEQGSEPLVGIAHR